MFKQSPRPQIKGTKEAREPEKEGLIVPGRGFEDEGPAIVLAKPEDVEGEAARAQSFDADDEEVGALAGPGWSWANPCNAPLSSGTYSQMYPTRHVSCGGWRSKTEVSATYIMNQFWGYVACNTYVNHPPGYWYDARSIDVWGWNSRGNYLNTSIGWQVWDYIWQSWPNSIQYVIYKRYYYGYENNWIGTPFGSDSYTWHDDHLHMTFFL